MMADPIETGALRKNAWRLMPLLTVGFMLNVLYRANVGFASLQMNQEIGLTSAQFGFGAGLLMLAYCICAIPSNLALYRFGIRRWLGFVMIVSGLTTVCCAMISGPSSFYALRLCLGVADAGSIPGVAFMMLLWFPADYRARMLAIFLLAIPASNIIGAPLSGALLEWDRFAGVSGWQWVFIVEGLPSVVLGLVALRVIADRPAEAGWLTVEERIVVEDRLASESRYREITHFWDALKDTRVLALALIGFASNAGSFGIAIWLPQILKTKFESNLTVGVVTGALYVEASVGMLVWANVSDRSGRDVDNLIIACGVAAVGLLLSAVFSAFWPSLFWLSVALTGIAAGRAILWAIPSRFLTGIAAAGAMAFIYSVSTLGGFVGPAVMGWLKDADGSFSLSLVAMAGFLLLSAMLSFVMASRVPQP
jgi:ACS family tartrate transporter-like MFS transporter